MGSSTVAYLQHSAYGSATSVRINNNADYITGYQANNEPTCGYTGTNEECNRYCNDETCNTAYPNSILSSTTENISGIYDMSGGAWEYMMSIVADENNNPISGRNSLNNSGFNGTFGCPTCDNDSSGLIELTGGYDWPQRKYYDLYVYYSENDRAYVRRILGDATGEMGSFASAIYLTQTRHIGSWYNDEGYLIYSNFPWLGRGYYYYMGNGTGIMAFGGAFGSAESTRTFRVVLTPTGGTS